MSRSIVLLDRENARIFHLTEPATKESFHFERPDHHTHRKTHEDMESPKFYEEVAEHLKGSGPLLLLGHGVGKGHFKTYLEMRHPTLAKQVIGCETVDAPTDGQVLAMAVKFFPRGETLR